MKTTVCDNWDGFREALSKLVDDHEAHQVSALSKSPLLFRGHSDTAWQLTTTLERSGGSPKFTDYYRSIQAVKPQIEAYTENRWEILEFPKFRELACNSDASFSLLGDMPGYDFMAYLRHHGFPSPLLDWSRSPMIAAFFAFRDKGSTGDSVAVYAYREYSTAVKFGSPTAPRIAVRGPYVRTHRRHFLQQCQYTMCYEFQMPAEGLHQWQYTPHDGAFAASGDEQDTLWKFTIPRSERERALAELDKYNLNAYSLFGSEDALMEMLAARELRT